MSCSISSYGLLQKAFELFEYLEYDDACELAELKAVSSSDKFDVFRKMFKGEEDMKEFLEFVSKS